MTLADEAVIVGDTENHRQGEGYERTMVFNNWDEHDRRRLARVQIRVDRSPVASFARVDVWVPSTGWQHVTAIGPEDFWESIPSYTRGQTHHADREVLNLADRLIENLIETGI